MYVEGGDDAMLYGVGLSYNGTQGVMKQSGRDVLSFNIDLRYRKGKFSFDNKFTLDYTESQNAPSKFSPCMCRQILITRKIMKVLFQSIWKNLL